MYKPNNVPYGRTTITATATAEQLDTRPVNTIVTIIASLDNGVNIFVGFDNNVTNTNYFIELQAGDSVELLVNNADMVWVYAIFTSETHDFSYAVY